MLLIDVKGDVMGKANYDRFNKLPWYKKMFGNLFYKYKEKFIDMEGFGIVHDIDTSQFKAGHEVYLSKDIPGALTNKKPKL